MFELIFFGLTFFGLLISTYTDIKERIVPDWVSLGMIILGLGLNLLNAFMQNNFSLMIMPTIITALTFLGAMLFWKIGFWAGGDVKLFTGIAALNQYNYGAIRDALGINLELFNSSAIPVFPLSLFFFSIFSLAPLGIIIALKNLKHEKQAQEKIKNDVLQGIKKSFFFALAIAGALSIGMHFSLSVFFLILGIFAVSLFAKKKFWIFASILFAIGLILNQNTLYEFFLAFGIGIALTVTLKLFDLGKLMAKKIPVLELKEGMIPSYSLIEENGKIEWQSTSMKSILNNLKNNNVADLKTVLLPKGKVIVSSNQADGLSNEQIKELIELSKNGVIEKEIKIKETTAFVPAILLAYIFLQTTGDILWNIIL